jgi:hypothetical protein
MEGRGERGRQRYGCAVSLPGIIQCHLPPVIPWRGCSPAEPAFVSPGKSNGSGMDGGLSGMFEMPISACFSLWG